MQPSGGDPHEIRGRRQAAAAVVPRSSGSAGRLPRISKSGSSVRPNCGATAAASALMTARSDSPPKPPRARRQRAAAPQSRSPPPVAPVSETGAALGHTRPPSPRRPRRVQPARPHRRRRQPPPVQPAAPAAIRHPQRAGWSARQPAVRRLFRSSRSLEDGHRSVGATARSAPAELSRHRHDPGAHRRAGAVGCRLDDLAADVLAGPPAVAIASRPELAAVDPAPEPDDRLVRRRLRLRDAVA